MKRLLALMLALLVAATMMVACGNVKEITEPKPKTGETELFSEVEIPEVEIRDMEIPEVKIPEPIAPAIVTIPEIEEPATEEPETLLTEDEEAMLDSLTSSFIESLESSGGGMLKGSSVIEGSTLKLICTYQATFEDETVALMSEQMESTMAEMIDQLTPMGDVIKAYVPSIDSVLIVYDDLAGTEIYSVDILNYEIKETETEEPATALTEEEETMLDSFTSSFIESLESSGGGMLKGSSVIEGSTLKLICTYQATFEDETVAFMSEQIESATAEIMDQLTPMGDVIKAFVPSIDSVLIVCDDLAGTEIYSVEI